jgi:1-aminocyclopropane-1-carboxylate deaminase/D-cysteine desulfhydrase-like pyridoxal-dependent ACC family enzyme
VSALDDALESMARASSLAMDIRQDLVIERMLTAFQATALGKLNYTAIQQEVSTIAADAAFDTEAFPLAGTAGIDAAWAARLRLQAARDNLLAFSRSLRKAAFKTNRLLRTARVYIRQLDVASSLAAKALEEITIVSLREIASVHEEAKVLCEDVNEALEAVNDKTRTLDSWFALHKQYIFLSGVDNRANNADDGTRRLGTRRH